MTTAHSCVIAPHLKTELGKDSDGKYGRMFADNLTTPDDNETTLLALSRSGSTMDMVVKVDDEGTASDNPRIAAGFPIFGQFIAHDITADRSLLVHHASLAEIHNFRTPSLNLETVYGAGPTGEPFLYDLDDSDKFLIGVNDIGQPNDVPRNQQGRALVSDPRNDVHLLISQLHLAFLKFHNRIVDTLRTQGTPAAQVFSEARRLVTWHYQWIVVHEFLPLSVGQELVNDIVQNGPRFYSYENRPYIPVEFADAAYRFGHSQIRPYYMLNSSGIRGQIFPDCKGTCPVPHNRVLDWSYFFALDNTHQPQASKRIDTRIAHALIDLPESVVGVTSIPEEHSIAYRDLERGRALDLPSGEALARVMGVEPLRKEELGLDSFHMQGETPLWYYILKEAEVRHNGEYLGDVGGRIVAEVLIGLVNADPNSYHNATDEWQPSLPGQQEGDFTIADLLRFVA